MSWLTVRDNVQLVLPGVANAEARANQALLDVGLGGFEEAFPGQLSGGMQRRAALARAFVVEPDVLLMDEPFVSLDSPLAWRLRGKLMELWEGRKPTVLYVTHDLNEALTLSDRVLFFSSRPGRVVLDEKIALARPRAQASAAVRAIEDRLLGDHPELLSGLAASGDD